MDVSIRAVNTIHMVATMFQTRNFARARDLEAISTPKEIFTEYSKVANLVKSAGFLRLANPDLMQLEGVWVPERIEATIQEVEKQESLPLEKKLYTTFACTAGHLVNMCDASMKRARSSKPNNKIIVYGQTDWQPDSIDPNARHPV